jgi:hypothetical protein
MRRLFIIIAPIFLGRAALSQSQPVTNKDSAVAAVRAVYQEVETAIKEKRLVQHDTSISCETDEHEFEGDFTIWRDSAGIVRRFDIGTGNDDSAEGLQYYYDSSARLRFIFGQYGAVVGSHLQERVYFDENRQELKRLREYSTKRQYPFGRAEPVWHPMDELKTFCRKP